MTDERLRAAIDKAIATVIYSTPGVNAQKVTAATDAVLAAVAPLLEAAERRVKEAEREAAYRREAWDGADKHRNALLAAIQEHQSQKADDLPDLRLLISVLATKQPC